MRIALGADHRGAEFLAGLAERLRRKGHELEVFSCDPGQSCDYPDYAWRVGVEVAQGRAERGMLLCGSGIGMAIAANKIDGVRAALVHDELSAQMSRGHNDANVLCLAADLLNDSSVETIVDKWLTTEFEGGRHARRVGKIALIEQGRDPTQASAQEAAGRA